MALAVDNDKEHVGTPHRGCPDAYAPLHSMSPTDDPAVRSDHSRTGLYTFVYNTRSVHMYCQNKVSIFLLFVLINQILVCKVFYILVNPQSNAKKSQK